MNLHLSDRQKQTVITALESFRSRKQAQIVASAQYKKDSTTYKELRQPENEYDILSAEHSLMNTITILSTLTNQPIAFFANPNPSQLPEPKTHTEGPGQVPVPNQMTTNTLLDAQKFFIEHANGSILCVKPDGSALECHTYIEAENFFGDLK